MSGKWTACLFAAILLGGCVSAKAIRPNNRILRARVRFLATSSSIHSSWAGNQDVYLARIEFQGKAEGISLALLVDEYPSYGIGIPSDVLTSQSTQSFRLRRDRSCDVAYGLLPLRTAPGDPFAILPEPLKFQPRLGQPVDAATVLPCYRTVHK